MSRLLVECGEALHGPRWQTELARDLGVSDRTVRRWVAGTYEVPAGLYLDLLRLTQERAARLDALAGRLRAARTSKLAAARPVAERISRRGRRWR